MNLEREKLVKYGTTAAVLAVALLSLILCLILRGDGRLQLGFAMPRISPTPTIAASPTPAKVVVTPAPTPIRLEVQRQYPPQALDLVADGRVLFTLENEQEAQEVLERYLSETAHLGLGYNERLIRAGFDQKLTLEEPSGKGELLNAEEAVNTLKADEGLLPVVRIVERCTIEQEKVETFTRENVQLLEGSRIYRSLGVNPYTLSYFEAVYRGQAAFSEVKTNEFSLGPGRMDKVIEDGGYAMEEASPSAGPKALKITGFSPNWPVSGNVTGSFGMTDEGMRYGVEITSESVARVMSPAEGVIVYCGERGDLGLVIDILHDDTGALSRIIGCQRPLIELYQRVKKGEQVAVLPEPVSGRLVTISYELHINGIPVNPEKYLPKR